MHTELFDKIAMTCGAVVISILTLALCAIVVCAVVYGVKAYTRK